MENGLNSKKDFDGERVSVEGICRSEGRKKKRRIERQHLAAQKDAKTKQKATYSLVKGHTNQTLTLYKVTIPSKKPHNNIISHIISYHDSPFPNIRANAHFASSPF